MRREEGGREVDGEKAVGSIKLIKFITYCENVPPKEIFPYSRGTGFPDLDR